MKKLLLAGSSLVALALFVLGGIEVPNQNAAVATNPAEVVSTRTLGSAAKNSEQIPDTTPLETGEVLGAQSIAPAQPSSLSASQTSGARSSSDVFNNVVEPSNDSNEVAYSSSSSRNSSKLKSAPSADLSVSAPTTVRSFGPNGTHWPTRTPFMYDETVASVEVDANWDAIEAAIGRVTKSQADAGFRILVRPGTLVASGKNPSGGQEAVANVGSADWNKRVVVAPRDGYGTVTWTGGTRIHKVFNVAFAGFIVEDGLKATGNSESAFAWMLSRDGQHGFYGTSGQTTTDMEIVEFVVPDSQGVSDDNVDIYSGGGVLTNVKVIGSYLAPRFWLYKDCGTDCPHTDTLQYAKGSGGSYSDMYIIDSALFASNNATVQTGNVDKLVIDHSYLIGGESSRKRYDWLPGASSEGYQQVMNGSGKNFEAYDSIIIGTMGINSTDAQYPWKHVSNTKTNSVSARYVPATGAWTVDPTLTSWGAAQHDLYAPRPTEASLLALWGKNNTPRTSAPSFSPAEETHNTSVSVSLASPTAGATIYYTTNGSTPTTASTRYTGPFTLSSTATVKAIATSAGIDNSFVQTKTYTIIAPGAPTITTQPVSTSAAIGGVATFTVQATANPAISGYQWKKNGVNIAGATSASYTTPLLTAADSGSIYTVAVTNSSGTTLSSGATLTVAQLTSSTSFQNFSVGTKTGSFTASFDVTPAANGTDMVTGLSGSAATSYGSMSAIVRMKDGKFDVHSTSGTYTADTVVPYVAGQTYRVEIDANVDTDKYSVRVNGTTIATNRTFRTAVSSITHLTYVAASGPHTIGNITFGNGGGTNQTPVVNVGTDKIITLPTNSVTLDATATDDGAITTTWTKSSGAGTVTFGNEALVDTTATFSTAGTYVLRLTANDGDLSAFDELTVIVNSPTGVNQAPVVSAGSDRAITLPANSVSLDATVTDDGLPAGSSVSTTWTKISGAGTVSFANANAADTTATFSAAGTYVLRLSATDGSLTATDEVTVIVNQGGGTGSVTVSGELKKWHKVTLSMTGPTTSESATPNPFRDYKADVTFTHTTGRTYTVPAYFAADGNAGETSATSGNVWRAHFAPDLTGTWTYAVSFREGSNIAISTSLSAGSSAGYFDGATGSFSVANTDKSGKDLRGKGRLVYDGEHYLKFSETGERFIKAGVDSPENFLAYNDFDNTPDIGNGAIKTWSAHAGDYVTGDPSWQGGKGTEIIGAVNYLSNQGLNSFSFLTYNVTGDDGNVYPFTSAGDEVRFDASKLDQWGEVFDHATKKGMYMHFKLMETENDMIQTNDEFKLYARELVARYGHNLALNWNLGEENGRSVTDLKQWATYLKDVDAYDHNRVLHLTCGTWPTCNAKYFDLMGSGSDLTGFSLQGTDASNFANTFEHVKTYVDQSAASGKKWVIGMDEPGDASTGVTPDGTGNNHDLARKHALWGTIMAGGQGVEWYYGGSNQGDITLTDFRSRNNFYTYNKYAIDFLTSNGLPVVGLTNQNSLVSGNSSTGNKVLAKTNDVYLVQLINGGSATLNLSAASGTFNVKWLNPRTGAVTTGANVSGGGSVSLSSPDANDWIVLVKKGTGTVTNQAPVVNAGNDLVTTLPGTGLLNSTVSDDGLPTGSLLSAVWTKVSGPGTVTFENALAVNTNVTFSAAGTYVLQLSATDGTLTGTDQVQITVTSMPVASAFNSAGGVVVIESENTSSSLGSGAEFWALRTPGNAAYVENATNNAHLEYRSTDVDALFIDDTPGDVPLEYTFKINEGGFYQLHIRSHKNIEDATRPDLNNDAFIKMSGVNGSTFTAGPNAGNTHLNDAPLSMLQAYTKIAGGSATTWAWADQLDAGGSNNKRWPVYGFQTGGTYTLTMAGRSRGFAPDRIVLRKVDTIPMPLAKNYAIPQSSKIDGGTNPNITPITFGSTQVRTTELVNVRPGASLTSGLVGKMPFGSFGTIVGGPTVSSDNITWWQVDFAATTTDGWTGQDNLEVIPGGTTGTLTVNAMADITMTLPVRANDLRASVTGGMPSWWKWEKVSGPKAEIEWNGVVGETAQGTGYVPGTGDLPPFARMTAGSYVFKITVANGSGVETSDTVSITVLPDPENPAGLEPVITLTNPSTNLTLPVNSVTLRASAVDPDGFIDSKSWNKQNTTNSYGARLSDTDELSLTGLTVGTHRYAFTVYDNSGMWSREIATVVVASSTGTNVAPTVSAGADVSITLPASTATLTGTATDSDGAIASRVWTKVSGPAATLSGQTTNTLSLSGLVEGTYVFRLTATDNGGATGFDEVTVTVANQPQSGVLQPLPSSAVQAAISVPLIEYNKDIPGGAFTLFVSNGGASITLAANSYAGDTSSDARLLEQIRYSIRGDKTIYANGGYPAQHEKHVTGMFTMAKYTPRIWNQITAAEKEKIDAIMTASLIGNAFTTSDTGPSTPRTLDGDTNLSRDWNPNYREGMIGGVLVAIAYFGPDQAQAILSAYDHTVFTQKLNTLGLTNPAGIFAQESASSVHSAVRNYKYYGRTVQDYMGIYDALVSDTFGRDVTCASAGGSIDSGCAGLPNLGQPGMLKEFNSTDALGGRSSIGYAYDGYRPHLTNQLVLIASGLWDKSSATATKTKGKNLVAVGSTDLIYKLEKGYTGYSKGKVEPSENITSPDRGYRYTLPIWNDVLRPFHGLPKAPNPDYGTSRIICATQCVPGTEIEIFKTNVKVRNVPTTVGNIEIGLVQPGDKGVVLEGPTVAGGITWYRVQYSTKALTGWSGSDNMWVATPSVPDTENPSIPANLRVSGVTANTVALGWDVSTDNRGVTGYEVRQNGSVVSNSGTNSFTATGLTLGQTYDFAVRAFDAAGNKSGYSTSVATTTYGFVDTQAPSVPTNLKQAAVSNTSATITWTASTDNVAVTSYEIFRGATPVGTSAGLSFTDNGLTRDTAYSYTVKAKDAAGNTSASSVALSVRTTDVTSKNPVRVPSFGPNGTHWPDKIPTPFMYDETVPSIVINPSWTELKAALQSVTKAQADAGLRILIKDGVMVGNGMVNYSHNLQDVGSATWNKRVTVAPLNGYGRVTWTKGVSILNVQGVAFAGFKVENPGIRFKGNNRSALAWINISGGSSTSAIQLLVGASSQLSVADTEIVEVVMRESLATDSDTFAIQGLASGSNSITKVTVAGSYFAPRFVTGGGHTDTVQFATGNYTDQSGSTIQDTAIFGSSNGALQVGSLNGLTLDNTVIMSGDASKSRYPILSGGNGPVELAFNGGSTGMKTYNSIFIGGMGAPDWDVIENTRVGRLPSVNPSTKWIHQPSLLNWKDDAAGYANIIPMPTDAYLAQIWAKDSTPVTYRTLTTSVTGSGTVSGTSVPTQQYVEGTSVTLTATPATGGTFLGWSGACTGTSATCTVVMSADKSVSAAFTTITAPQHLLTVAKNGTGTGSVTGNPAIANGVSQLYLENTSVVLTATPSAGSTFAGWSGACTGTSATCTVTMNAAKNVTATFNLVTVTQYALTVNSAGTGAGAVSGATSGQQFPSGTVVTLTATPSAGSTFAGWSGACTGTSATCNVTMSSNKTATATFNLVTVTQYTLTVAKSGTGTGSVTGSAASQAYNSGTVVALTATADAGSTFAGWSGACTGTSATCNVTMSSNKTATATFTLIPAGQVATPTFSPSSMTSATPVSVTITTATPGSTIRYTTNGSTPTSSSTLYSGPISVSSTATIKAIALKSGMTNSAVGDATYTISSGPTGSLTSSTTWAAKTFAELSGTATRKGKFEVRYTATPLNNNIDSITGLSNGTPSSSSQRFTVFGPIVRFNAEGKIDARNGGAYAAASSVSYSANANYAVRMEIDVPSRTYSAWVDGVQIANNYAFRSEQSTVTQLSHFGYVAVTGSHRMTNVVIGSDAASDTTAPTAPTGLTSSNVTQTSAQINWSASTDAVGVTGYEILRNGTVVGNSDTTSYVASGLTAGTSYAFTVRAFDAAGNKSAVSSSLTVVATSPITVTSAGTWAAKTFAELSGTPTRTGSFEVTYTAKPSRGDADVLTGLSNVVPTTSGQRFTVFGPIVIFDKDGKIKARNGGAYVADTSVSYVANGTYNIKMQVNVATRTYSVWVDGVKIATDYAFRSEQSTLSQLSYFGYVAVQGSHQMSNIVIGN